jgi:hypothetical protein
MYHPAAILRTPTPEMRRIYEDDFRKIPLLLAEAEKKHVLAAAHATAEPESAVSLDQLPLF